jgi:hypothetical protein
MGKEAIIGVPAGFGDIFWVYQKFYKYFDNMHFVIYTHGDGHVEQRSIPLVSELPKVASAMTKVTGPKGPRPLFTRIYNMDKVMKGVGDYAELEFGCNKWLELGNYLEDLDKEYEVEWNIPMPDAPLLVDYWEDSGFLTVYLSGDTRHLGKKVWSVAQWTRFIKGYRDFIGKNLPVLIIGADFDRVVQDELCRNLVEQGVESVVRTNLALGELSTIFKKTEMFIGYQSGLNILADNCNGKQIMLLNIITSIKNPKKF